MDIDQLIKSCKKRNPKAQEKLYHLYNKKLFLVCLKYCSSYEEAEDHLHDVFIEVFGNIKNYKGKGSFEGWMKRIAINWAIDKYKKNRTYGLKEDTAQKIVDHDTHIDERDLPLSLDELLSLIQELPNQYRLIFNLYELDHFSHKEIAEKLEISEGTSKSNLHRAKILLKKKILAKNSAQQATNG